MTRLNSIPLAIGALALLAGGAAAFAAIPNAATPGLTKASNAAGKTVPVRAVPAAVPAVDELSDEPTTDLPDAASHGGAVSAVATAEDTTPDTNHGVDVSTVAKDNHGQATAAQHKPDNVGKPDGAGQPEDPGQPDNPGPP